MIRFGLCCIFREEPIRFCNTTAAAASRLSRTLALAKISRLCAFNAESLLAAIEYCSRNGIGCFRVNSQILPLKTHPLHGYAIDELPDGAAIVERFRQCGALAQRLDCRICFHPDQFVVLSSPRLEVVEASLRELEYQCEVAEWVGADVVNIHAGGSYGDKSSALATLAQPGPAFPRARRRITLENDDKLYSPSDLLPLCRSEGVPLVYDVHHHRCHRDELTEEAATDQAIMTWDREPLFHISSPLAGWDGPRPQRHHDFIDVADFPSCWRDRDLTVEVEAKAKEIAVKRLLKAMKKRRS